MDDLLNSPLVYLVASGLIVPLIFQAYSSKQQADAVKAQQAREDRLELREYLDHSADYAVVSVEQGWRHAKTATEKGGRQAEAIARFRSFARKRGQTMDDELAVAFVQTALWKRRAGEVSGHVPFNREET